MLHTRTESFSNITLYCFGSTLTGSCARAADAPINTATNTADNETCFIFVPPVDLRPPQMTAGFAADSGHCARFPEKRQALRLSGAPGEWKQKESVLTFCTLAISRSNLERSRTRARASGCDGDFEGAFLGL